MEDGGGRARPARGYQAPCTSCCWRWTSMCSYDAGFLRRARASSCACAPGEICRSFARGGSTMTIARVVPRGWLSRRVGVYGEVHLVSVTPMCWSRRVPGIALPVRSVVSVRCLSFDSTAQ